MTSMSIPLNIILRSVENVSPKCNGEKQAGRMEGWRDTCIRVCMLILGQTTRPPPPSNSIWSDQSWVIALANRAGRQCIRPNLLQAGNIDLSGFARIGIKHGMKQPVGGYMHTEEKASSVCFLTHFDIPIAP